MFFIAMKLLENVIFLLFAIPLVNYNETIRKCDVLVLTIPLVTVSIAIIRKCDVLLLTIPAMFCNNTCC